jgi:di/tricarboxylate transporter
LILIGNQFLLRPDFPIQGDHGFARNRLRALGSFKLPEWITAAVVMVSIVFWATDQYHHLPSFLIGMLGVAIFALSGILKDEDIATAVSWPLLLFLGGVFGLANVIQEYKITDWFAGFFVPLAQGIGSHVVVLVIAMALIMFALRFLDPSSFIAISVQFLSIVDVTRAAGLPPLVLMAPIIIACVPFWMTYQNFWVAMGEGLTSNQAFTARQRVRLANGYALCVLISLTVAVGYWKLIGVLM